MKRLLLSAAVLAFAMPCYAQEGTQEALDRIGSELGRLNRTLEYGPLGGGGGGFGSGFGDGIMVDGLVYHPYYFTKKAAKERAARENRYKRAKAAREKQAARRVR